MFISFVLFLTIVVVVIIFSYFKMRHMFRIWKLVDSVPGRKTIPILGNSLDYVGSREHVFRAIRKLFHHHRSDKVARTYLFMMPWVFTCNPGDIERILTDKNNHPKGVPYDNVLSRWLGNGLLISSGEHWFKRRRLLTPTFHFNILQKYLVVFNKETKGFIDKIRNNQNKVVDLIPEIANFTLEVACQSLMGVSLRNSIHGRKYQESIEEFIHIGIKRFQRLYLLIYHIFILSRTYQKERKVVQILHSFSTSMIQKRKEGLCEFSKELDSTSYTGKRQLTLLDQLLTAQKNGEDIDDSGIREEIDTFVFEAHDTTSAALVFTLMLLANNRSCQDAVFEEISSICGTEEDNDANYQDIQQLNYMDRCIRESLRLYPSVPFISRVLNADVITENGLTIPAGVDVAISIFELHRRSDIYQEPEKFDPGRFLPEKIAERHPFAYIPFSGGYRNCIGQKFAMVEMKCLLTKIIKNYILEPIDTPESIILIMDIVLRTKCPVRVKFVPRKKFDIDQNLK